MAPARPIFKILLAAIIALTAPAWCCCSASPQTACCATDTPKEPGPKDKGCCPGHTDGQTKKTDPCCNKTDPSPSKKKSEPCCDSNGKCKTAAPEGDKNKAPLVRSTISPLELTLALLPAPHWDVPISTGALAAPPPDIGLAHPPDRSLFDLACMFTT